MGATFALNGRTIAAGDLDGISLNDYIRLHTTLKVSLQILRIRNHASDLLAETGTVLVLSLPICAHASAWKLVLLLFLTMFVNFALKFLQVSHENSFESSGVNVRMAQQYVCLWSWDQDLEESSTSNSSVGMGKMALWTLEDADLACLVCSGHSCTWNQIKSTDITLQNWLWLTHWTKLHLCYTLSCLQQVTWMESQIRCVGNCSSQLM